MRGRLAATALAAFAAGFLARGFLIETPPPAAPPTSPAPPAAPPAATPQPTPAGRATRRGERPPEPQPEPAVEERDAEAAPATPTVELAALRNAPPAAATVAAPTLVVRGRCVSDAGAPVAGVRVHLFDRSVADQTRDDGRFELTDVPAGAAAVNVFPEGRGHAACRIALPAPRDGIVDLGDVVLRGGGQIRGRFVDLAGRPVAGARVWLDSEEAGWLVVARATTDVDGRFVLDHVGDGVHAVSGRSPTCTFDGGAQDAGVGDVFADGREVLLKIRSEHWVRLQYVDERGTPIGLYKGRMSWCALDDPSDGETFTWEGGGWDHGRIPVRLGVGYEVRYECLGWQPVVQRVEGNEEYDRRVDVVFRRAPK